jgi:hypothetical protein
MRPAFQKDGVGTAGNASIISDGAAAVVVMSREKAEALGCTVMASIGAQASYGIEMKYVLVAPIWAIPKCLAKGGHRPRMWICSRSTRPFQGSTCWRVERAGSRSGQKSNVNGGAWPGPPHRGQRLPGAGDPAARDDSPGQQNRTGLLLSGRRRSRGHGGEAMKQRPSLKASRIRGCSS